QGALLDPRFKKSSVRPTGSITESHVLGAVRTEIEKFYREYAPQSSDTERQPTQDQTEEIVGPTQPKRKSCSLYSTVIEPRRSSSVGSSKALEELEIYLNEPTLPMEDVRPLEFWRLNSHRFPVLSPIARDIFGIPASSGSVERVFSTATDILSAKRNRIKPCLFQSLLFIKK
ncbi:Uncharacterized protein APZ42_008746, partial [Daphnia magna]